MAEAFAQAVLQQAEILRIAPEPDSASQKAASGKTGRGGSLWSFMSPAGPEKDGAEEASAPSRLFATLFRSGRREKEVQGGDEGEGEAEAQVQKEKEKEKEEEKKKKKKKERKKKKSGELGPDDISDPTEFRHLAHIGFNAATGAFDVENIPADWKHVFQKAGVTKRQLQDKDMAGFIVDFVQNAPRTASKLSIASTKSTDLAARPKGPPPPPPAKTFKLAASQAPPRPAPPPAPSPPVHAQIQAPTHAPPPDEPARAQLLASIRSINPTELRPTARTNSTTSIATDGTSEDQSDIMASMLAKALADRNRKLAHSGTCLLLVPPNLPARLRRRLRLVDGLY